MSKWNIESLWVAGGLLLMVAILALLVAAVITLAYGGLRVADRQRPKVDYWVAVGEAFPYIAIIALIGGLSGQVAGGSREGVVGDVLPALFTAFGGFTAYYVGIKRDRRGKVAVNSVAFLLAFFVMYNVSAIWRQDPETWRFCRDLYTNPDFDDVDDRVARNKQWNGYCQDVFDRWTKRLEEVPPQVGDELVVPKTAPQAPSGSSP